MGVRVRWAGAFSRAASEEETKNEGEVVEDSTGSVIGEQVPMKKLDELQRNWLVMRMA